MWKGDRKSRGIATSDRVAMRLNREGNIWLNAWRKPGTVPVCASAAGGGGFPAEERVKAQSRPERGWGAVRGWGAGTDGLGEEGHRGWKSGRQPHPEPCTMVRAHSEGRIAVLT